MFVVHAAIAVIVGGHLYDLVRDEEHWPFSHYGMYSYRDRDNKVVSYQLAGLVEGDAPGEFPLVEPEHLRPMNVLSLGPALGRVHPRANREALWEEALRDCLARYEARRRAGAHNGPPLRGARLYRLAWDVKPMASNRDRPDQRELVHEVVVREGR
jgi:hypothetical protein